MIQGQVPNIHKTDLVVRPLLKKPSLDRTYRNCRQVSNLTFISKLKEDAVHIQFMRHVKIKVLSAELQSAYRRLSSTEKALLKILDDILLNLDSTFDLVCSVPQGSKLGPRLYSQYIRFLELLLR